MKRRKRSAFVPRSVLGASFSAVIPACVLVGAEACSSGPTVAGVAAVAYCCFEAGGVADAAFVNDGPQSDTQNDSTATDAPSDAPSDSPGDGSEGG